MQIAARGIEARGCKHYAKLQTSVAQSTLASDLCGAKHVSFRPQFTGIGGVSFRPLWRKAREVHQMASQGVGPAELYVAAELQVAEHADVHEMESMCRKLGMVKEGVPRGRLAALSRKIDMLTVQARQC